MFVANSSINALLSENLQLALGLTIIWSMSKVWTSNVSEY